MKSKHIPQKPQECVAGLVKIFYPLFKPRVLQPVTLYVMRNTTVPEIVNVNGHIQPAHPWFARICAQGTVDVPRGCKVHREGNQTVIQISPHCRLTMLYYCIKFPDGCFLGRFFDGCGDAPYGDAQLD